MIIEYDTGDGSPRNTRDGSLCRFVMTGGNMPPEQARAVAFELLEQVSGGYERLVVKDIVKQI